MARILIKAIQNGQESLAREIILKYGWCGGIDSQTSRRDGTALFFCSSRGYIELSKMLLDRGASVNATDKNRATPLHGAVDNGHLDVVKLLIAYGANVNAQTYRGDTSLHLAAYRGYGEIAQCLIRSGADWALINCNSFTAENEARGQGHHDLCDYIRSVQIEQFHADRDEHLDSMIQLDPPSIAVTMGYQTDIEQKQTSRHLLGSLHWQDYGVDVRRDHNKYRTDVTQRSKSCDFGRAYDSDSSDACMDETSNSQRREFSERLRKGVNSQTFLHLTSDGTSFSDPETTSRTTICPCEGSAANTLMSGSSISWSRSISSDSRPNSSSPGLHHQTNSSFVIDSRGRNLCLRPPTASAYVIDSRSHNSIGSAGSSFSDFSLSTGSDPGSLPSTGSDPGSLPSTGSDGNDYFIDGRRDDTGFSEQRHMLGCVGQHNQANEMVLLSLGVKNPPGHHCKRQLSESSQFSDIYDSTLFSLSSVMPGPRSLSVSEASPSHMEFAIFGIGTNCSRLNSLEVTNDQRPRLNRATSVTCSFPSPNVSLKIRPEYTKSLSTDNRPEVARLLEATELSPRLDRMLSNDLSPPFSVTDKPSQTMTCINIPLK